MKNDRITFRHDKKTWALRILTMIKSESNLISYSVKLLLLLNFFTRLLISSIFQPLSISDLDSGFNDWNKSIGSIQKSRFLNTKLKIPKFYSIMVAKK